MSKFIYAFFSLWYCIDLYKLIAKGIIPDKFVIGVLLCITIITFFTEALKKFFQERLQVKINEIMLDNNLTAEQKRDKMSQTINTLIGGKKHE
jgi:hypothetical protein